MGWLWHGDAPTVERMKVLPAVLACAGIAGAFLLLRPDASSSPVAPPAAESTLAGPPVADGSARPSLPVLTPDDRVDDVSSRLVVALEGADAAADRMALRWDAIEQLSHLSAAGPDELAAAVAARNAIANDPSFAADSRAERARLARLHRFEPTPGDVEIATAWLAENAPEVQP